QERDDTLVAPKIDPVYHHCEILGVAARWASSFVPRISAGSIGVKVRRVVSKPTPAHPLLFLDVEEFGGTVPTLAWIATPCLLVQGQDCCQRQLFELAEGSVLYNRRYD